MRFITRRLLLPAVLLTSLVISAATPKTPAADPKAPAAGRKAPAARLKAHKPPTSAQVIREILSNAEDRDELTRLNAGISALLADKRLSDQPVRQMLQESKDVLTEMLNRKIGTNAPKLIDFARWMRAQAYEQHAIHDAGVVPTPQQQFVLDNELAGQEVHLTSVLMEILRTYLEKDRENAGAAKLEGLLQLYLNFRTALEHSWQRVDDLLLFAPQWIQSRYPQLAADQKRQFLDDVNDARADRALGPGADQEPVPPPPPKEQAAYERAYQFIVKNTPPP